MQTLSLQFPANTALTDRAQVGCVGSGDMEVLLQPADDSQLTVEIITLNLDAKSPCRWPPSN